MTLFTKKQLIVLTGSTRTSGTYILDTLPKDPSISIACRVPPLACRADALDKRAIRAHRSDRRRSALPQPLE
ncbi:unnamed protein product [Penicillium camemberti]|uniref:Str. FM013 n=1 Tax=Penicillium camemberti (strain FM 013) TaxID=1429867 RepID=A0A0G4NZS5_PENC3|nr:unnamed protein product [Penicillium camemberti]